MTQEVDRGDDYTPPTDEKEDKVAELVDKAKDEADKALKVAEDKSEKLDEDDKEEDKEDEKKRIRIPKSRLDEVVKKAREKEEALNREIERLSKAAETQKLSEDLKAVRDKIDELEEKADDLMADGKTAEAKAARKEARELRDIFMNGVTKAHATAAQRAAVEQLKYDMTLERLEAEYPVLNPDDSDFDEAKAKEVHEVMSGLVQAGQTRDRALARAVKYVLGAPAKAEEPEKEDKSKDLAAKRAEEARKKALDATKGQPPNLASHGADSDKHGGGKTDSKSIMRMSQEEFAKLDPATLAQLRGDVVT